MSSTSSFRHVWRYWLFLFGAVVFEVAGTCVMKMGQNGSVFTPESGYGLMLLMIAVSYYLLSLSTQVLPVGVAFAFWEGLGLTFITLASVWLGESLSLGRILALCAVLTGAMLVHHGTESTADREDGTAPETGLGSGLEPRQSGGAAC